VGGSIDINDRLPKNASKIALKTPAVNKRFSNIKQWCSPRFGIRSRPRAFVMTTRASRPRGSVLATRGRETGSESGNTSLKSNPGSGSVVATNTARQCLAHVCESLKRLGVGTFSRGSRYETSLSPELLRRAKFDEPCAVEPLWVALHDLYLVRAAGFPGPEVSGEVLRGMRDEDGANDGDGDDEGSDATEANGANRPSRTSNKALATYTAVALTHLAIEKYPRISELRLMVGGGGNRGNVGGASSRSLLIALAWR